MRRWLVLMSAVVWVVGACSDSQPGEARGPAAVAPATSAPVATAPSTTTGPSPDTTATTVRSSSSAAPACTTSGLTITAGPVGAALGHAGAPILFRNKGDRPCRLVGYPKVAGLDGTGRTVVSAEPLPQGYLGGLRSGAAPPVVELLPGQTASALVEGTNIPIAPATSCGSFAALSVAPPDQTDSVRVPLELPDCSGLQVHPVVPGPSGR